MTYQYKFEALGAPTRLAVFEHLRSGPACVGDIAESLPVSRPAVSQHLKILKDAGLVKETRAGVKRVYYLDTDGLAEMRDYFDGFWTDVLEAYRSSLEK